MGDLVQLEPGQIVNQWKIEKKLGEGAFGAVYKCSCDGKYYALKTEGQDEKIQLLKMEVFVLMELSKGGASRHFCQIADKGQCASFNYVVMTLVGKSLQDLRLLLPKRRFSMGTAISVGIQCLEALEDLHSIGYLHRDVKPGNYTVGRADMNELRKVYVLDFGMARKFVHDDGTMKKPRAAAGFRGTVRYAALSCHMQREMCRKDDVESWVYMLIELTKGKLPWRNLEDQDEVGMFKKDCRKDALKQLFGGCPRHFVDILRYCDSLRFFDTPDYQKIYGLLRDAMTQTRSVDTPYDWEPGAAKLAEARKTAKESAKNKTPSKEATDQKKSGSEHSDRKGPSKENADRKPSRESPDKKPSKEVVDGKPLESEKKKKRDDSGKKRRK